jgi:hypothetical protein
MRNRRILRTSDFLGRRARRALPEITRLFPDPDALVKPFQFSKAAVRLCAKSTGRGRSYCLLTPGILWPRRCKRVRSAARQKEAEPPGQEARPNLSQADIPLRLAVWRGSVPE